MCIAFGGECDGFCNETRKRFSANEKAFTLKWLCTLNVHRNKAQFFWKINSMLLHLNCIEIT